jgi:flagellar FliJ protein
MRKKGFRLNQVLHYRKEMEKVRKQEFAETKQELEDASNKLNSEEERVERVNSEFMDRQQEGITASELQIYSSFFRKKRVDIKNQRANVGLLNHELTVRREILLDASKEKKILETLEKKNSKAIRKEIEEKERGLMEEIAIRGKK